MSRELGIGRITAEAQWELELHRTVVDHLVRCRTAYFDYEEGKDHTEIDDPSFAPFDDCEDCVVREVLMAAWPAIEEHLGGAASGTVLDPDEGAANRALDVLLYSEPSEITDAQRAAAEARVRHALTRDVQAQQP